MHVSKPKWHKSSVLAKFKLNDKQEKNDPVYNQIERCVAPKMLK